jgi:hypothetical protein
LVRLLTGHLAAFYRAFDALFNPIPVSFFNFWLSFFFWIGSAISFLSKKQ